MTQRFTMLVAVHLLLLKDDQILLARRFQTGYQDGNYSLPAGHVEANESVTQAAVREIHEEIGIMIQPTDLFLGHVMHRRTNREYIDFFFVCKKWTGEPTNTEPEKCDEVQWFPIQALPENTTKYTQQAVSQYLKNKPYSELGWT